MGGNGKGDARRPLAISDAEMVERWMNTFANPRIDNPKTEQTKRSA